jgi:hypothetical protein
MKRIVPLLAVAAFVTACGTVTGPDPSSPDLAPLTSNAAGDVVIQCDPALDPECDPGEQAPMLPPCDVAGFLENASPVAIAEVCSKVPKPKKEK